MDLKGARRSSNVDDQRGGGGRGGSIGIGLGTIVVVVVVSKLLGADPIEVLNALSNGGETPSTSSRRAPTSSPQDDELADFSSAVLATTEDVWRTIFQARGSRYVDPTLVLFRDRVSTACGGASSATGPFYCPGDHRLYLDLSFFTELRTRFGAPGDFAEAYVIAHEVGHHVQSLLGIERTVREQERGRTKAEKNALSVRLELQADCFAGVWAKEGQKERKFLQPGDLEEALGAAAAVGDDTLQKQARGTVVPETFTHGSSAQRMKWFRRGFQTGTIEGCDTFSGTGE